ncbi:MAG: biopolymer transport protein ExbD [Burkholderiales bacterium]
MLVLMIRFITVPVMNHRARLAARGQSARRNQTRKHQSIDRCEGAVYWIAEPIDPSRLRARIADAAAGKPQPELHLRAERTIQYMGEWHK